MTGALVDVTPRFGGGRGAGVFDAEPVTTYRVLDERPVSASPPAVARKPFAGRLLRAVLTPFARLTGLLVAFVAMIARSLLGLAMVVSLIGTGLFVLGGLVTGVGNAYVWAAVSGTGAFLAFVAICVVTEAEVRLTALFGVRKRY